ncbi:MAG TPA: ABC transporter ATP-binding protein [Thermotogota bacterium]|mgnify:CR=1 FL=1|nr:ABC transporter ATP-binding protein [Thermotogota bacterium]HRW92678.1 ABC transporter ATP-binding protein [Thermotogota bacterium]
MHNNEFLEVKNLKKFFPIKAGFLFRHVVAHVMAVDDVSFSIGKNRTFGLVGESGCGKSTVGRCVLKLIEPTDGQIVLNGEDIAKRKDRQLLRVRREMQIVFQDPTSSLNPRMTVGQTLSEPLLFHGIVKNKSEARDVLGELLLSVGMKPYHLDRYPHQFSGGQRQRIAIARAITVDPSFIVLDEPTSALDVSVQAQIIALLKKIQQRLNAGYLFISHDLSVVRFISDEVGIMYLGKIVETGDSDELFDHPLHPYSQALLEAAPVPNPRVRRDRKRLIGGQVPSPINRPSGCFFRTRCPRVMKICESDFPALREVAPGHKVACHLY